MEDSCLGFSNIFARFQKAALLLGFVLIGLFAAVPANAQETVAKVAKTGKGRRAGRDTRAPGPEFA